MLNQSSQFVLRWRIYFHNEQAVDEIQSAGPFFIVSVSQGVQAWQDTFIDKLGNSMFEEDTEEDSAQDSLLTPLERRIRYGKSAPATPREASAQWKRRQAMPTSPVREKSPKHANKTAHQDDDSLKEKDAGQAKAIGGKRRGRRRRKKSDDQRGKEERGPAEDAHERKEEEEEEEGDETPRSRAAKKIALIGDSLSGAFRVEQQEPSAVPPPSASPPPPRIFIKREPDVDAPREEQWETIIRRRIEHAKLIESQPIMRFLGIVALHASVTVGELLDESGYDAAEFTLKELLMQLIRGGPESAQLYTALSQAVAGGGTGFMGSEDATAWLQLQLKEAAASDMYSWGQTTGGVAQEYIVIKPTVRGAIETVMLEVGKDGQFAAQLISSQNKASVLLGKATGLLLKQNQLFAVGSRYTNNRGIYGAKVVNLSANQNHAIHAAYRNAVLDLQLELGTYQIAPRGGTSTSETRANLRILSRRRL